MSGRRPILGAILGVMSLCVAMAGNTNAQTSSGQQAAQNPSTAPKTDSGQHPTGDSAAAGTAASEAPKADPKEEVAYKAFYDLKPDDAADMIQQGEQFLKNYPQSRYRGLVYSRLTQAYFSKRDMGKMFATGQRALEMNPDDYTVMTLLGWVIPHTSSASDPQAATELTKAENYSRRAIELLQNATKPANLSDGQFQQAKNQALSQAHSGLGLTYFRQTRYADSVTELQQSVKLGSEPDATDYFVMGIDLTELKRNSEAAEAFDQCGKLAGGLQARCQENAAAERKQAAPQAAPAAKP